MIEHVRSIKDFDVRYKVVLVRVDFNLPMVGGKVTDTSRLVRVIPTLKYLIANNAKIILLSHYGNPKGKFILGMSLSPVVDELSKALGGKDIKFAVDILESSTKDKIDKLLPGEIMLVENIRFHAGEEENDIEFAKKIARLGDIYVNESFSCSHRNHASIVSLPKLLPSAKGLLLAEELENLNKHLQNPVKKVMAITGGAKVSSKIALLKALIEKADHLVIGGAMANTFLKAKGYKVGRSLYEEDYTQTALTILKESEQKQCKIILPSDVITAKTLENDASYEVKSSSQVSDDDMILDVGPRFLADIIYGLDEVKTVIWNGPLGAFELKPFDIGTITISRAIAESTLSGKLTSIAGGGDVVSAINSSGLSHNFTYISTGGGAFLKWLEGKTLPGIQALMDSARTCPVT